MDTDIVRFFDQLDQLTRAGRMLGRGDLAGTHATMTTLGETGGGLVAYRRLGAALLFHAGRIDDAQTMLSSYLQERPDDFDALLFLHRMLHARSADRERMPAMTARLTTAVLTWLERIKGMADVAWPERFVDILRSPLLQDGQRSSLLNYIARRILSEDQKAAARDLLLEGRGIWPPDERLRAAGALLLLLGATDAALDELVDLSAAGTIGVRDYPSAIFAVNLQIGQGDPIAHRRRYAVLDRLYRDWVARIRAELPAGPLGVLGSHRATAQDRGRIAVLCSPLVTMFHAPTNRAVEIAAALKRDHGYDVRIFEGGSLQYRVDPPLPFAEFYNCNYNAMLSDRIGHGGVEIPKWRTFLDDSQYQKFLEAAAAIRNFRPGAVIVVGDASPVQDLLFGGVPVIVFPTNSGAPVGPADRYVSLWDEKTLARMVVDGDYPAEVAARSVFGAAGVRLPEPSGRLTRDDLVPGAGLVLATVGARLSREIRGDFARRLAAVLERNPWVHLLCIGDGDAGRVLGDELRGVASQVHCRAFEADLAGLMTGCDAFLNPPRQGGGTSVAIAMRAGCPVLCAAWGDGATLPEPGDLAADLDDYFARLEALIAAPGALPAIGKRMAARVEEDLGFGARTAVLAGAIAELGDGLRASG